MNKERHLLRFFAIKRNLHRVIKQKPKEDIKFRQRKYFKTYLKTGSKIETTNVFAGIPDIHLMLQIHLITSPETNKTNSKSLMAKQPPRSYNRKYGSTPWKREDRKKKKVELFLAWRHEDLYLLQTYIFLASQGRNLFLLKYAYLLQRSFFLFLFFSVWDWERNRKTERKRQALREWQTHEGTEIRTVRS